MKDSILPNTKKELKYPVTMTDAMIIINPMPGIFISGLNMLSILSKTIYMKYMVMETGPIINSPCKKYWIIF